MELSNTITAIVVVVLVLLSFRLMHRIFIRWLEEGQRRFILRPLSSYDSLQGQIGLAIESGSQMHATLGQASLSGNTSPTTIAALKVLDHLAEDGCASETPPLVTVGESTTLLAAQDSLYAAYRRANKTNEYRSRQVQFVAHETQPFVYAGGVASVIQQDKIVSNVMVGHFGAELALMAVAAERQRIDQVIGTDNPVAMALATAVTDKTLIGEELFVAGAYLEGKSEQIASLRIQDILRFLTMGAILVWAIVQFVINL